MADNKVQISTSEKIYADSLIQAGKDGAMKFDEILADLNTIKEITSQSKDLVEVMENPAIDDNSKYEIIDSVFSNHINNKIINFLKVLINKKRFKELDNVIQAYSEELDKINNIKRVEVISAVELTKQQMQRLTEKLQNKLERNVIISSTLNKDIIGGLVIKIDDDVIDNSLKNKLENLSKNII